MSHQIEKPARPVLRLIKGGEPQDVAKETQELPADQPKSALGLFMKAYADAIDRDVKLLLEI